MASPQADPCAAWRDSAGNFDFLAFLNNLVSTVECAIAEAQAVKTGLGLATGQHLQLAASNIRAAQILHAGAKNPSFEDEE